MANYAPRRTSYDTGDRRWLADMLKAETHGVTIDGDIVGTPGTIKSGTHIGIVTATGRGGRYAASTNEVQTLNLGAATAGTVTITFDGETTAAINFNATAAAVQTAMEGLSNVNAGDVTVTGGPLPGTITLTFAGQYRGVNVPQITVTPTGLTGGTVTVATTTQGGSTITDGRTRSVGHILDDLVVEAGKRYHVAVVHAGTVRVSALPADSGHDAGADADLTTIAYI